MKIEYPYQRKVEYLIDLCYKYGDYQVIIQESGDEGQIYWKQWKSVLECWEEGDTYTLYRATHRTPCHCECFLDYEPEEYDTDNEAIYLIDLDTIKKKLRNHTWVKEYKAFYSGNRGIHIEVIFNFPVPENKRLREALRAKFITDMGAELMKCSDKSPIMLPGELHRKTQRTKIMIKY